MLTETLFSALRSAGYVVDECRVEPPFAGQSKLQLLKAPLMRGVKAARATIQIVAHAFAGLEVDAEAAKAACAPELYATHRALELVLAGTPFRDAYRQVAAEVDAKALPETIAEDLPNASAAIQAARSRLESAEAWQGVGPAALEAALRELAST